MKMKLTRGRKSILYQVLCSIRRNRNRTSTISPL